MLAAILILAASAAQGGTMRLEKTTFKKLNGWAKDDHAAAFAAFVRSCKQVQAQVTEPRPGRKESEAALGPVCGAALELAESSRKGPDRKTARLFFERHFSPYRVRDGRKPAGLFTGYYEPVFRGSKTGSLFYPAPVRAAPPGMDKGGTLPSRAEIENGALDDKAMPLVWLADPVDAFFLHIQGSGRIELEDGSQVRLAFAGRNGHPYSSIGKALLKRGILKKNELSMDNVQGWLRRNPAKARALMQENASYIFFRKLDLDPALGPIGGQGVPLTARRSLAIDRRYHAYGLPMWLETELPGARGGNKPFRHLMVAQDTGAAITGPARGDIFFGTGPEAGAAAGRVKVPGKLFVLRPRTERARR